MAADVTDVSVCCWQMSETGNEVNVAGMGKVKFSIRSVTAMNVNNSNSNINKWSK